MNCLTQNNLETINNISRPPLVPTEPTVFGSIPVQKKFGQPFAANNLIPAETPRRTPSEAQFRPPQQQQNRARLPVAQEPVVQLIPVENSGFQATKQQPRLRPIAQQIPEEQPRARPVPQIPLVEEESFEELEDEEEPELIEAQPQQLPKQQPLPQQQRPTQPPQPRRPIDGVFSIPQQQDEPQVSISPTFYLQFFFVKKCFSLLLCAFSLVL